MAVNVKKIEPLNCNAGYLEARRLTAEKGMKLASHVLHDDYLVRSDQWKNIRAVYPAWVREIIVHPEKGKRGI